MTTAQKRFRASDRLRGESLTRSQQEENGGSGGARTYSQAAHDDTQKEFADELAKYTRLNPQEAQNHFPTKADQGELLELLKIVHGAADENERKAKLVENAGKVAGAMIKITKKFACGIGYPSSDLPFAPRQHSSRPICLQLRELLTSYKLVEFSI